MSYQDEFDALIAKADNVLALAESGQMDQAADALVPVLAEALELGQRMRRDAQAELEAMVQGVNLVHLVHNSHDLVPQLRYGNYALIGLRVMVDVLKSIGGSHA